MRERIGARFRDALDKAFGRKPKVESPIYKACLPHADSPSHQATIQHLYDHPGFLAGYPGEWVAMDEDKIVGHAPSIVDAANQAKAQGVADPFFIPMPAEPTIKEDTKPPK